MKKIIDKTKRWIRGVLPITRRQHNEVLDLREKEHHHRVDCLRRDYIEKLDSADQALKQITEGLASIRFSTEGDRRSDRYMVSISFSPEMLLYGSMDQRSVRFMAEMVGRQVEAHIAQSRFVHPSWEDQWTPLWKRELPVDMGHPGP